ncbi:MAG TPA: hypothetical protein PK280_14170 [Planctomycetota bacterium]|nr:hypothetical protein [Planctomycetota bacterium]
MHPRTGIALTAVLLLALAAAARADVITLEDGRQITGQIIEETPTKVTIKVPYGSFSMERSRILSIEKQSPLDYHLAQGDNFADRGEFAVALREYREAVRLAPDDKNARAKLASGLAKLGRHWTRLRRFADARTTFEELAKLDPGNIDARLGFATLDKELAAIKALVAEGDKALAVRRYEDAAAALAKAMEADPETRADLAPRLASALRGLADERYAARKFDEAAGLFAQALVLRPDLAAEVEGRFISSVMPGVITAINSRDLKLARERLGVLIGFAPTDPRVCYLQGAIFANEGNLAAAAESFARGLGRAASGTATPETVNALHEDLRKALGTGNGSLALDKPFEERYQEAVAGDWLKLEGRRFTVYHHNEKLAAQVLQSAEYYLDKISSGLALPERELWAGQCPIYIYRNQEEYRAATKQEEWSGGVYSLETRGSAMLSQKISTFQTAPKLMANVLPHEIAHLAFMSSIKYGRKFPLVLHEGVATFNEPAFRRSYFDGVLKAALKTDSAFPVDEVFKMTKYPEKTDLFYGQGLSMVEYLVAARGAETFYKFAQDIDTLGVTGALNRTYGFKDLDEFERFWKTNAAAPKNYR